MMPKKSEMPKNIQNSLSIKKPKKTLVKSKTLEFGIDSALESKKIMLDIELRDKLLLLFTTVLVQCGQCESAVKMLEQYILEYCTDIMTRANANKLCSIIGLTMLNKSSYASIAFIDKCLTFFMQAKSILGSAITRLWKIHILCLQIREEMEETGVEDVNDVSKVEDLEKEIEMFKYRIKQIMSIDSRQIYKDNLELISVPKEKLISFNISENPDFLKLCLTPIFSTKDEHCLDFTAPENGMKSKLSLIFEEK